MYLQTCRTVLFPANVADQRLGSFRTWHWAALLLICFICRYAAFSTATFHVPWQGIGVECSAAPWTRLKRLCVVLVKCSIVIPSQSAFTWIKALNRDIEASWWLRTGFPLIDWLFLLFYVPFVLTWLQMDLKACGSKLSSTYIADEWLWFYWQRWSKAISVSCCHWRHCFCWFRVWWFDLLRFSQRHFRSLARLCMSDQAIWIECATTFDTWLQRLRVVIVKCFFIVRFIKLSFFGPLNCIVNSLWSFGAWSPHVGWLFFLFDVPLLLTWFQMDFKTRRAILSSAYVTHKLLWASQARIWNLLHDWLRACIS